jgi:MraZ protein
VLFSGAFDQVPDKQGRISLPQQLRDYAGLDRDVVIAGNGATAEIWNAPAWEQYLAAQEQSFSELARRWSPGCSSSDCAVRPACSSPAAVLP